MDKRIKREDIEFRIRLCSGIFIGVILLAIVALYSRPLLGPMKTSGSFSGHLFRMYLAASILALPIARYVVWRGLRTIGSPTLDAKTSVARGGLVYSVAFIGMWPLFLAIVKSDLAAFTHEHSIILAGIGALSYLNFLMLAARIRRSVGDPGESN